MSLSERCNYVKAGRSERSQVEKSEAFFDGHVQAFQWFGGVVRSAGHDNIKTAVLRILLGPMREENSDLCAPGKGNEKGAVENGVGASCECEAQDGDRHSIGFRLKCRSDEYLP
ncbi:MAG TPA: hypothetical protein DCL63_05730 [Firmicutes bacterium]|nr:hypothetical protein [Bacillota bacterium]